MARRSRQWLGAVVLFAVSWGVYLRTLAPTITWAHDGADGGDLIAAAYTLGIPHPTGYPLYTLCAKLFTLLPVGSVAYRVNLMSATFAAAAVALVYLIVGATLGGRPPRPAEGDHPGSPLRNIRPPHPGSPLHAAAALAGAATAALALAFSAVFWSQAVIAEVYAMNAFFVALTAYLLFGWFRAEDEAARARLLCGAALAFGLGMANHLTLALMLPAGLFLLWRGVRRRPVSVRTWGLAAASLAVGLSVYAYLPLRAAQYPPIDWGGARTWPGFAWVVSGRLYRDYVFALPWAYVPARLSAWAALVLRQFGPWGVALALIGARSWLREERDLALFSAIFLACNSVYAVGYNTTDSYVYLIPTFLVLAVWLGGGVAELIRVAADFVRGQPRLGRNGGRIAWAAVAGLCLLAPAGSGVANFPAMDLSADTTAYRYGVDVLADLPAGTILFSGTDAHTFALWYCHYVEGAGPDVAVVSANLLPFGWYRETVRRRHPWAGPEVEPPTAGQWDAALAEWVTAGVAAHPVYATEPDAPVPPGYILRPDGPVYRVVASKPG